MTDRVVLAYSGGLDTSVGIGWLKDATGKEVVALAVDVGQGGEDMDDIRQRALDCGAVESIVVEAQCIRVTDGEGHVDLGGRSRLPRHLDG